MSMMSTGLSKVERRAGGKRFGRIPDAEEESGLKRTALYKLAARHRGLFKKYGAATIVDLRMLHRILAALPDAAIGESER
jgi:hypothetical protein